MTAANGSRYAVSDDDAVPGVTPRSRPISGSIDATTPPPNGPRNPPA